MTKKAKSLASFFTNPQIWSRIFLGLVILLAAATVLGLVVFGFTEVDFNKGKALGLDAPSISGPRRVSRGEAAEFKFTAPLNGTGGYILYIDWGDGSYIERQRIRTTAAQNFEQTYQHIFATTQRRANIRAWLLWRGRGSSGRTAHPVTLR